MNKKKMKIKERVGGGGMCGGGQHQDDGRLKRKKKGREKVVKCKVAVVG